VDGDFRTTLDLGRRREELEMPPDEMFRSIAAPALALAGELDLNVDPGHARRAVRIMGEAGNERARAVTIAGADHSFQEAAGSEFERLRERFTFESFQRPYRPEVYREMIEWLRTTVPSPVPPEMERLEAIALSGLAGGDAAPPAATVKRGIEIVEASEHAPERLRLAAGIEIVECITDKGKTAGVETLEGRIGPLLLGDGCQAHYIDMPSGMYVEEHPHSSESIIYTVRGRWVLCSDGRRHVMKAGALFRFAAGTPTGYEVPFAEDAFLLIFKGDRLSRSEKELIDYLRGMREKLQKEAEDGVPYLLRSLPADHAARRFAREINPEYERALPGGK
jgi:quercetin dioxygenase-like cupin family protein